MQLLHRQLPREPRHGLDEKVTHRLWRHEVSPPFRPTESRKVNGNERSNVGQLLPDGVERGDALWPRTREQNGAPRDFP